MSNDDIGKTGDMAQCPADNESLFGVVEVPDQLAQPLFDAVESGGARVISGESLEMFAALGRAHHRMKREVEQMRAQAKQRIQEERRRVLQKAQKHGYREAFDEVIDQLQTRAELRRAGKREAVDLAFEVAERLVGDAIEREPARVGEMIEQILRRHPAGDDVKLVVNPADRPAVEGIRSRLRRAVGDQPVHIEADESVSRGGCVLRTGGRRVDATLEVRLEAMKSAILDE